MGGDDDVGSRPTWGPTHVSRSAGDLGAPIRVEAVLLSLIVFLGINVAWALMFDEVEPVPGPDRERA